MGPIIIFDKSLLQSLNPDEAMWLDNFFLTNITPLFFIETLADLEKEIRAGRTPEDVVGNLAYKTPDMSSKPNAHHTTLLEGELLGGGKLDMELGRPHISGGQARELGGKTGVIFQPSPEEEAFARWQKHEFLQLERLLAKAWRQGLSNINLEENYKLFQTFFPIGRPKTLEDVRRFVDFHIDGPDQENVIRFGLSLIGFPNQAREEVVGRWRDAGKQSVRKFAPYFTHVFSVDFFFYLAIAADLIGRGRPSHKIDLAYLYYLPFCMVFASNDKLHASIVPFFLRENQTYISGTELKADLAKLDKHYDALPDEVKQRGVMSFASYPPDDESFLVTQLWDKHMSPEWRKNKAAPIPQPESEVSQYIIEEMRRFKEEGTLIPDSNRISTDKADHMVIERKVLAHKGKWTRFPPEVISRKKNEKDVNG
jgi:hypothetical protein